MFGHFYEPFATGEVEQLWRASYNLCVTGERILHYQVVNRLGAGGMGEVYLAQDTRLGRPVALKFLPASYQYDPGRRDRFFREARAASSLSSPNIAAIYDIGEHDGTCFIAMEYVEGDTLTRRISTGPLPFPEVVDITTQVADALDEARLKGVVHRDIKSSNLMLTSRGLVKILDFGLARILQEWRQGDSDQTLSIGHETSPGIVLGTVSYMSPEQALGRATDHRSDIFSLGVVTYEMLTGRLPFDGESATQIIDRILHADPPAIARLNYSVPLELERIVRKTLEKDAEFRYQTARELYIDLRNLRRDLEGSDRARSSQSLSPEMPTQLLPGVAVATAVPAAVPAIPAPANAVAVMTFRNITGERGDDWIGSGIAETVTGDLKNVGGVSVIGRERIFELLKNIGTG
ncbi:MAG TPA: serine/threonine-protein kinase, partial [Blastocatellia bacterium]|nr:serine/threonine-protein kinase [Blastocatellia bacterium]